MVDLHCDKPCWYNESEHCTAKSVYYVEGRCRTMRLKPALPACHQVHPDPLPVPEIKRTATKRGSKWAVRIRRVFK